MFTITKSFQVSFLDAVKTLLINEYYISVHDSGMTEYSLRIINKQSVLFPDQ